MVLGLENFIRSIKPPLESTISSAIISRFNPDYVIDIGANIGQFAYPLVKKNIKTKFISIEANPVTFQQLSNNAKIFDYWEVRNYAVVPDGWAKSATLHLASNNGASSSLLPHTEVLSEIYPFVKFSKRIEVDTKSFTDLLNETGSSSLYIKFDIQGFEKILLESIRLDNYPNIKAITVEVSNLELYHGEWDFYSALKYFKESNFQVYAVTTEDFQEKLGTIQFNLHFSRVS